MLTDDKSMVVTWGSQSSSELSLQQGLAGSLRQRTEIRRMDASGLEVGYARIDLNDRSFDRAWELRGLCEKEVEN
ncbi:hypothetical protein TorRG33x02_061980 [Trema orientale]|uniref:Uncharacterized protein n=1 Tax=Trema orientale TaxID=63057 RepID=A0A2P5FK20_TREOI|nr:hypothetical protein TorRG33x02_061980 [Trema orientale]